MFEIRGFVAGKERKCRRPKPGGRRKIRRVLGLELVRPLPPILRRHLPAMRLADDASEVARRR